MDGAVAKISVTTDVYLAGSDELKGQLHYTLDIGADAQAEVAWNLDWKATNTTALEAGLKFLLALRDEPDDMAEREPVDRVSVRSHRQSVGIGGKQRPFLPLLQAQRSLDDSLRRAGNPVWSRSAPTSRCMAAAAWMPTARCCSSVPRSESPPATAPTPCRATTFA